MADLRALVADPEFLSLPADRQRTLAAQIDPDVGQLDVWGQDRLLTRLAPDPYTFTEQRHGLPAGLMKSLQQLESSGGTNLVSRTGVMGPYQITGATGRAYGLPDDQWMDELAQLSTAGNILADNLKTAKGDIRAAVNLYADPNDRAWYADRILARLPQQQSPDGAQPGASIVAAASPAPTGTQPPARDATPPLPLTATTTSPTSQTFGQETRQRAGFGPASASGIPGVLGQTLDNLNLGPFGPLLKVLGLPGAVVGTAVNQAGDSRTAGDVAQIGTDLLGGRVLAAFTPRARAARELSRLRVLNPGRTAETMEATAGNLRTTAVRDAAAKLGVTPQAIEKATGAAVQEARSTATRMSDRALAAARESDAAGVVPTPTPATPGRTITSPILNERGEPFTTRVPGQPARTVTPADVPPDLVGERAITRSLSDAAQHFARYVEKAETAATPKSAVDLLLRGAKVSGFGKAGVKLPAADAAAIEVQVGALVDKMLTASPTQGVKLLERAATLKGVDIPELTQAKALLADAESFKGQAAEVAARMDALQRYLQSPTLRSRVTHLLLPTPVRKLLAAAGAGAAGAAGYEAFRRD